MSIEQYYRNVVINKIMQDIPRKDFRCRLSDLEYELTIENLPKKLSAFKEALCKDRSLIAYLNTAYCTSNKCKTERAKEIEKEIADIHKFALKQQNDMASLRNMLTESMDDFENLKEWASAYPALSKYVQDNKDVTPQSSQKLLDALDKAGLVNHDTGRS